MFDSAIAQSQELATFQPINYDLKLELLFCYLLYYCTSIALLVTAA